MDRQVPDELLSAYYDGEATPAEVEQVEAWLEASLDGRRQLEEVSQVSELLRSLPRHAAPDGFTSAVVRQAERESLPPAPTPVSARPVWSRRDSAGIFAAATATVALAAAVMVIVSPANRPSSSLQPPVSPPAVAAHSFDSQSEPVAEGLRVPSREESLAVDDTHRSGVSLNEADQPQPADRPAVMADFLDDNDTQAQLDGLRVGDVVRTLDDRIGVIEMTVIDVQKAAGQVQLVLQRNKIPPPPDSRLAGQLLPELTRAAPVAVYVEAPDEQLASALDVMQHSDLFVDVRLQPPITPDELAVAQLQQGRADDKQPAEPAPQQDLNELAYVLENRDLAEFREARLAGKSVGDEPRGEAAAPSPQAPVPESLAPVAGTTAASQQTFYLTPEVAKDGLGRQVTAAKPQDSPLEQRTVRLVILLQQAR